ncbi:MAG: winged helix-turn-helix domain-containing protein [Deltaproteobacteria bacterium]|jgi:transposase|nr:MAG: winged helix-turn-helix domain-containing protein [Deltaproteobacteria bacterium]
MRPQRPVTEEEKKSLQDLLKKTKTKADFQRVQCLWLRAEFAMSSEHVGTAIGYSPATVKKLWSEYFSKGEKALIGLGRGGRRRANLSTEAEKRLLADFFEKAERGRVLVVTEVKNAYEKAVGHPVPKSTVYRMLARYGWRKVAPRPRHPKFDPKKMEEFKKNSRNSEK